MRTFNSITKEELMAALEDLPEGAQVAFASDYGDHCHTNQVHSIEGKTEEMVLRESAYSDSGWAVMGEEEADDWQGETKKVWVIS